MGNGCFIQNLCCVSSIFRFFRCIKQIGKEKDNVVLSLIVRGSIVCPHVQNFFLLCISLFHDRKCQSSNKNQIEIQQLAVVKYPWNASKYAPNFTGQLIFSILVDSFKNRIFSYQFNLLLKVFRHIFCFSLKCRWWKKQKMRCKHPSWKKSSMSWM